MKRLTDEKKQEIIRLYPEHSARQIAGMIGMSRQTVATFVKAQGLKHTEEATKRLKGEVLKRAQAAAHSKVRRLLKNGLAHVVCRIPFTIQLDCKLPTS